VLEKAYFARKDNRNIIIPCKFNPKELSIDKGNQYSEINIPGLPTSVLQFVKGNNRTISMELFFDTYEEGRDVREYTDLITGGDAGSMLSPQGKGLMDIDSELHAPPVCIFIWGKFSFQCIIEKVIKRFTLFHENGFPVRATLNVSLKEYIEVDIQVKSIDTRSSDLTKRYTITEGDALWSIAAREYNEPKEWRRIAQANNIDNPRVLDPGTELIIPIKE
jgi:hypothetical protein